ncbi:hypothetical protein F4778DRAFT_781880 [Xylariomycetidae sp. FL2044]|nr:hypothetical protein F4778DRAFT_781880 [Xylariomycetidae sp. FL2044]
MKVIIEWTQTRRSGDLLASPTMVLSSNKIGTGTYKPSKIVHVGPLLRHHHRPPFPILEKYPALVDAAVHTGFIPRPRAPVPQGRRVHFQLRGPYKFLAQRSFEPDVMEHFYATQDVQTIGEALSTAPAVLALNGSEFGGACADRAVCPDSTCESAVDEDFLREGMYPKAADISTYLQPEIT